MTLARGKTLAGAAMVAFLSSPATAYYHFTHYIRTTAPVQAIQEKFDLNALPNKTLTFYVSDNGPTQLQPGDSLASVIGAFRQAIQTWDSVSTSDLRVAFGGLYNQNAPFNTPVGQIVFSDELPPGVVEMAGPTAKLGFNAGSQFVPITTSTIIVPRNLSQNPISSSEEFFTTAVHEIGHALGLQHTWTSSAMSTAPTRATTHAKPIDTDDIAGITLLYPKAGALQQFGSITGRILSGGSGVHLASVVAIRPNGSAVSALTQPDGSYTISGLPPDTYWVYTEALPPAVQSSLGPGDIVLPTDLTGRAQPASGTTETLFYPGTRDPNAFVPVQVRAGATINLNDINVQRKASAAIYDVTTYGYFGAVPNSPAFVNSTSNGSTIVAAGAGLIASGTTPTAGLTVQAFGVGGSNTLPVNVRPYTTSFVALDVLFTPSPATGGRHLYFTLPNDAYVLPNGLNLVQKNPPAIASVNPQPDGSVVVSGSSLALDTKVYFDSLPAVTRSFTGNDAAGSLVVVPPVGFSGQQAQIVAYNSDGQNSTFIQPGAQTVPIGTAGTPSFAFNSQTNLLPAGASAMVDITGINTQFVDGLTTVGFGTSDITVKKVWVLSPTHLWANVSVAPGAAPFAYTATVATGFQIALQPLAFQVTPLAAAAVTNRPNITLPVNNASPAQPSIYPGSLVTVSGSNLSVNPTGGGVTISLNDQPVSLVSVSPTQILFSVPQGMATGPALLKLNSGAADAYPVVVEIDSPPVVISSVVSSQNQPVDGGHPDSSGDIVGIVLQNLDPTTVSNPGRVHLLEGGVDLTALAVAPAAGQPGLYEAFFALSPAIASQQVQLVVTVDGVASNPVIIAVR
jgi:uncharacterized protein (TIGR03437 family)